MNIEETRLKGLFRITPEIKNDERGFFMEVYRRDRFAEKGILTDFVQENHTRSKKGVIRGLHYQWDPMLGKLIRVIRGSVFSVAVDIRPESPTCRQFVTEELSEDNGMQIYAPPGFATGFCVTSDCADVEYHYSAPYNPKGEGVIKWNDAEINIPWPIENPTLSARDQKAFTIEEWFGHPESRLFV